MTPATATQLRTALALSAYAVAKALGCSRTHYVLFERGERQLSKKLQEKLSAILNP